MEDSFDQEEKYPNVPGWKGTDTSEAAAERVKPRAETLRRRVFDALAIPRTGEQLANHLKANLYSILPRISEMQLMGMVRDSGERGMTKLGGPAVIWMRAPGAEYRIARKETADEANGRRILAAIRTAYKQGRYREAAAGAEMFAEFCRNSLS